ALFGSGALHAEQVDDDVEHSNLLPPGDSGVDMSRDDGNPGKAEQRLPRSPEHTKSIDSEALPDQDLSERPYPRASSVTPQHASARNDAQPHAHDDSGHAKRDNASRDEPASHAGGGGGGGGGSASGKTSGSRSRLTSSGGSSNSDSSTGAGGSNVPDGGSTK